MKDLEPRSFRQVETGIEGFERKESLIDLPLIDFVGDTKERWQRIQPIIAKILSRYKNPEVLDVAMGSGQDTLSLEQEGYDVISNEVDEAGISKAQALLSTAGFPLHLRKSPWEHIFDSSEYRSE